MHVLSTGIVVNTEITSNEIIDSSSSMIMLEISFLNRALRSHFCFEVERIGFLYKEFGSFVKSRVDTE